jgi:tRNA pseudouridine55 synthase
MDGKPLYEYAREGKPLPRPIAARKCTVSIELLEFTPASIAPGDRGHEYRWPAERLAGEEKAVFRRLTDLVHEAQQRKPDPGETSDVVDPLVPDLSAKEAPEVSTTTGLRPATFKVKMTVSSGTYVRSIVNDMGLALGCGAHVVSLTRTRQGEFVLQGDEEALAEITAEEANNGADEEVDEEEAALNEAGPSTGAIPWSIFTKALEEREALFAADRQAKAEAVAQGASPEEIEMEFGKNAVWQRRRSGPLRKWETAVLRRFVSVPVPSTGSHEHTRAGSSYR